MRIAKLFFIASLSLGLNIPAYTQTHANSLMQSMQALPLPKSYSNDYERIFSEKEVQALDSLSRINRTQMALKFMKT